MIFIIMEKLSNRKTKFRISWKLEKSTANQQNMGSKFQNIVLNVDCSSRTTNDDDMKREEMRLMYLFMKSRSAFSTILYGKIFPKKHIKKKCTQEIGLWNKTEQKLWMVVELIIFTSLSHAFCLLHTLLYFMGKMNIQSPKANDENRFMY